jgi:IS30 family transposase
MCEALGVSRGGFYAWLTRPRSQRSRDDDELGAKVRASFLGSDRTYGARRVWRDLLTEGISCGLHRIERLMRLQALKARPRRRRLPPDLGERQAGAVAPNVLGRSFEAAAPNRKWIADFTYVWTAEGWLFVAAVIDLFSRRVVGWSMSAGMTAQLVTDALVMAIWRRGKPDALLHHSDRGSQSEFKWSSQRLERAAMKRWKRQSDRSGRAALRSPGRPTIANREQMRRFWAAISAGLVSEEAAATAGVPQAVGARWFRKAGGMRPAMFGPSAQPRSGRYLSLPEREEIALLRAQGCTIREMGRRIQRAASTVSRELRRNAATRSGGMTYRATTAQWHAERSACRPKQAKLMWNKALHSYVQDRLSGIIMTPNGVPVAGPAVSWNGRRHGRRQHRRWARAWSPEQIARRLPIEFPDDTTMRISHEAIYQALFIQGRGALRRELTACLRTGRALRMPRARTQRRGKNFVSSEIMISQRPAEVADRAVPGHWEGDLILGLGSSAIGTLVERTTRFTMLLHLPRMKGHGTEARIKNGPALAGHGAEALYQAITRTITTLPEQLKRSLTWDQGAEMAQHARLTIDSGIRIYFCDPQSPWQRATNENTNGLLRQYFPKGTDLSAHSAEEIAAVATALNQRPRKTLDWRTPAEALDKLVRCANTQPVATTA